MTITRPALGRGALRALIIAASLTIAVATGLAIWFVEWTFTRPFAFGVAYAGPDFPAVASTTETQQFWGDVVIESDAPLTAARILSAIATALPLLVYIAAAIGVIVLALRMSTARSFRPAGRVALVSVAVASLVTAVVRPLFEALAVAEATAALRLPTSGDDVADPTRDPWVVPAGFDLLQDMDWPYLGIAVVLALVALLWSRAERMQKDTEGLV
ncbi:hypothetical protein [uncultured Microbacterium sp.]|uniref:hypothetical protein n=1 Tax=uncultured Microbacterium sp. TaxID=191216 RepID=UPI002628980E|nr:hypothetical protein [uncultured Microbacterium sp.]